MDKAQKHKKAQSEQAKNNKSLVWDCGSSLYDSFELKSFERQLDSAIVSSSRTLSMPRIDHHRQAQPPLPPPPQTAVSRKSSKISRSLHKLLKSVFGSKPNSIFWFKGQDRPQDLFYVHAGSHATLYTIPEAPEIDYAGFSPELNPLVRRTASERFTATPIGISCA